MVWNVEVVARPAVELAGVVACTDMQHAAQDCPTLWQAFMARMPELGGKPAGEFQGASYGLSVLVDQATGVFDYYACMPCAADVPVPDGMQRARLDAGLYACCTVPSLKDLTAAYTFMYTMWLSEQGMYVPDFQGCSCECYDERFLRDGSFDICVPVIKKS